MLALEHREPARVAGVAFAGGREFEVEGPVHGPRDTFFELRDTPLDGVAVSVVAVDDGVDGGPPRHELRVVVVESGLVAVELGAHDHEQDDDEPHDEQGHHAQRGHQEAHLALHGVDGVVGGEEELLLLVGLAIVFLESLERGGGQSLEGSGPVEVGGGGVGGAGVFGHGLLSFVTVLFIRPNGGWGEGSGRACHSDRSGGIFTV